MGINHFHYFPKMDGYPHSDINPALATFPCPTFLLHIYFQYLIPVQQVAETLKSKQ